MNKENVYVYNIVLRHVAGDKLHSWCQNYQMLHSLKNLKSRQSVSGSGSEACRHARQPVTCSGSSPSELISSLQTPLHFPTQALLSTSDPFSGSVPLSFLPHAPLWEDFSLGLCCWIIPVITACLPECGPPKAEVTWSACDSCVSLWFAPSGDAWRIFVNWMKTWEMLVLQNSWQATAKCLMSQASLPRGILKMLSSVGWERVGDGVLEC